MSEYKGAFQVFEVENVSRGGGKPSTEPQISISDKVIKLNTFARRVIASDYVQISFNRDDNEIILIPANEDTPNARKIVNINKKANVSAGIISRGVPSLVKTFMKIGIIPGKYIARQFTLKNKPILVVGPEDIKAMDKEALDKLTLEETHQDKVASSNM